MEISFSFPGGSTPLVASRQPFTRFSVVRQAFAAVSSPTSVVSVIPIAQVPKPAVHPVGVQRVGVAAWGHLAHRDRIVSRGYHGTWDGHHRSRRLDDEFRSGELAGTVDVATGVVVGCKTSEGAGSIR